MRAGKINVHMSICILIFTAALCVPKAGNTNTSVNSEWIKKKLCLNPCNKVPFGKKK